MEEASLSGKLVSEITGEFFVPSYQRGYRWERDHITLLLNDLWKNGDHNYCLQPVVVRRIGDERFELIDGQQRTTTLFLILDYMTKILPSLKLKFNITYETRPKSEIFLKNINEEESEDNIDFFHMYHAYRAIEEWFEDEDIGDKTLKTINLYKYFSERVKVIWYEVNNKVDGPSLFTRLNIGKIPLTNAELVKALFLSKDSNDITEEKQLEISTSWDLIERELQNDNLWYFLTNQDASNFATRIELLFNLMANKELDEKEKFFTFFYFIERLEDPKNAISKTDLWNEIQSYFLTLKEWYEKRDVYHKIGYLIAIGKPLQEIIAESKGSTKTEFQNRLDENIRKKLNLSRDQILELSYEKKQDLKKIENVLLLHNVETIRTLGDDLQKFSFDRHKKNKWSLEHIHAQQSEGLNKKEEQQEWLLLHRESLVSILSSSDQQDRVKELIELIDDNYDTITKDLFDHIFSEVFDCLSDDEEGRYIDSISNMALLSAANNSALNNSTFDVKRNKIIQMDRKGEYIPICTRRIFLKYYTDSKLHQLHFWGEHDRDAYIRDMIGDNGVLNKYLIEEES